MPQSTTLEQLAAAALAEAEGHPVDQSGVDQLVAQALAALRAQASPASTPYNNPWHAELSQDPARIGPTPHPPGYAISKFLTGGDAEGNMTPLDALALEAGVLSGTGQVGVAAVKGTASAAKGLGDMLKRLGKGIMKPGRTAGVNPGEALMRIPQPRRWYAGTAGTTNSLESYPAAPLGATAEDIIMGRAGTRPATRAGDLQSILGTGDWDAIIAANQAMPQPSTQALAVRPPPRGGSPFTSWNPTMLGAEARVPQQLGSGEALMVRPPPRGGQPLDPQMLRLLDRIPPTQLPTNAVRQLPAGPRFLGHESFAGTGDSLISLPPTILDQLRTVPNIQALRPGQTTLPQGMSREVQALLQALLNR